MGKRKQLQMQKKSNRKNITWRGLFDAKVMPIVVYINFHYFRYLFGLSYDVLASFPENTKKKPALMLMQPMEQGKESEILSEMAEDLSENGFNRDPEFDGSGGIGFSRFAQSFTSAQTIYSRLRDLLLERVKIMEESDRHLQELMEQEMQKPEDEIDVIGAIEKHNEWLEKMRAEGYSI